MRRDRDAMLPMVYRMHSWASRLGSSLQLQPGSAARKLHGDTQAAQTMGNNIRDMMGFVYMERLNTFWEERPQEPRFLRKSGYEVT